WRMVVSLLGQRWPSLARLARRPWYRWTAAASVASTSTSSAWRSRTAAISGAAWMRSCGGAGSSWPAIPLDGGGGADGHDAGRRRPPERLRPGDGTRLGWQTHSPLDAPHP